MIHFFLSWKWKSMHYVLMWLYLHIKTKLKSVHISSGEWKRKHEFLYAILHTQVARKPHIGDKPNKKNYITRYNFTCSNVVESVIWKITSFCDAAASSSSNADCISDPSNPWEYWYSEASALGGLGSGLGLLVGYEVKLGIVACWSPYIWGSKSIILVFRIRVLVSRNLQVLWTTGSETRSLDYWKSRKQLLFSTNGPSRVGSSN